MTTKWIKCNERMPEENKNVLIFLLNKEVHEGYMYKAYNSLTRFNSFSMKSIDSRFVSHWQPLPNPPEGEE